MAFFDNSGASEYQEQLEKALSVGYGTDSATFEGGRAIIPEDCEQETLNILDMTKDDCKVMASLKTEKVRSTVHEKNLREDEGDFRHLTTTEGGDSEETDQQVKRKTFEMKYVQTKRGITRQMIEAETFEGALVSEKISGINTVLKSSEYQCFHGDSRVVPTEFDGFETQIRRAKKAHQNILDLRGVTIGSYGEKLFDEIALKVFRNGGSLEKAYFPPVLAKDIKALFEDKIRFGVEDKRYSFGRLLDYPTATGETIRLSGDDAGADKFYYAKGEIYAEGNAQKRPAIPSDFTATPVASASGSKFTGSDAGDYLYEVHAVNAAGYIEQLDLSPIENWVREYKVEVNGQQVNLIDAFYLWAYNGHGYYDRNNSPITPYEISADISWNDISDYMRKIPVKAERVGKNESKDDRNFVQKRAQKRRDLRRQTAEKLFNRFLKDGLNKENAEKLCKDWNRQFNSYVNPDYRKIPIRVDGMCTHKGSKEFTLLDQQVKGISFLVNKGSGILAYDVGVGKTAAGIVATVNQLQTGRSKKPLICVPKAVYKKWIKEIHDHFPGQEVFELGNLTKQYFKQGDAIPEGAITICTYEALERMTFKDETIEEITEDAEYNAINPYNNKKKTRRDVENDKNKIDTLVGEMTKTTGQDSCYFEDLGFDHITVDEVHNFKNVFALPRNYKLGKDDDDENGKREANEFSKIRGSSSDRGKKMFAITQYLQRHNGNRNVYALSATPFTNSPTEIYSMLSLVARNRLRKLGIYSLHEFLAKFAELKTEYVIKPNNTVVEEQVVKSFKKLQALQNLITEYIDKVDGDEAGVIRPHKVTHTPELEMTDLQKQMIQEQIDYMSNASSKDDPAATIVAMNNMRMITLAPAIVDPSLLDQFVESSPKLKFVCDSIIKAVNHRLCR